jgi:hypothetical protein
MLRLRRRTISARFAALGTALLVVAWPRVAGTQARPSVAELLTGYMAWLRNPGATRPLFEFDLDAARSELARLAPAFLTPLEGRVTLKILRLDAGPFGDAARRSNWLAAPSRRAPTRNTTTRCAVSCSTANARARSGSPLRTRRSRASSRRWLRTR